ncbi:hypothetical protein D3C72_1887970 [compost metagenome]
MAVGLAQRHGANALQRSLHGTGHSTGIGDVIGHVRADVDARQDEIRLAIQHLAHGHDDAIRRRAPERKTLLGDLTQPQRFRQRQRMGETALIRLGRHHPDIVRNGPGDPLEDCKALGVDAIVVCQQDTHCDFFPVRQLFRYASDRPYREPGHPAPKPSRRRSGSFR